MISYNNSAPKAVNNVGQFGATEGSIGAYKSAAEYAADAKYWALLSQTKYTSVEDILTEVERLYAEGRLLEEDIKQLKVDFETQQQVLLGLIQSTSTAINNTNAATELSKEATQQVLAQLDIISNMTVQTTLLPPGSMATGSYDNSTGVFSFGIPEGQPGRDGTDGTISDIGNVAVGVPVSDDYGFYVDKEDGGLYRASMTDIANLVPSIRSISINGGEEQTGAVSFNSVSSFNSRTGDVVSQSGDYEVSQIIGAASSGANSDITSLSGLTTALSVSQGGTGATTAEESRTNLGLGSVSVEDVVPLTKGGTGATTADAARTSLGLGSVSTESIVPITKGGTGSTSAENARLALVAAKSGVNSDITSMTNGVTFTQPVSVADAVDATNAVNLGQISSDQGASLIGTLEGVPVQNIISNINTDIIQLKLNWAIENGYSDIGFTFTTGGTLTVDDRDKVVYDPVSKEWYSYSGTLPVVVPAGFDPVSNADWKPQSDSKLREDLAATVAGLGDNLVGHPQSGLTVNAEIESLKVANAAQDAQISDVESFAISAIKTSAQNLSSVKDSDPSVQYDGFGNTVFWNGRNLFCFRRSPSHLDSVTGKHSACIAEIYKDGSAAVIWEYVPPAGIAAKEPSISVSNPGNQLIIAFTLHDVAADTYKKTIVGYADLNNSGAFTSKSDIVTETGYYQWGNIVTTPDNKFMTSRYSVTGTEVQLITSSDVNLNGSTTWTVTKSFPISLFPGKSLINETCIGYYRGQLVAVIRSSVGSSLSGICLAKTNDTTGVNGWTYLQLGFAYAGPRIEAYTDFDDPLVITGTTQRPVTPVYRSDVSMTITYDLSTFSTSQRIYQGEIFSCYASAKKTTDGSYELISFDEVPDSGVGENLVTKIHRQNFYIAQDNRTKSAVNFKANWLQSVIKDTPCFGSLAGVSSTASSSNMYFSFNTAVSGVTRLFVMIGPVESELTITPVLRRADGTTFASFFNVSVPANTRPQIIELVPTSPRLEFNIYERLNLNFSSPLPLGTVSGITGTKLPITDRTPFGLYNVVGNTTPPYVAVAFGKL